MIHRHHGKQDLGAVDVAALPDQQAPELEVAE